MAPASAPNSDTHIRKRPYQPSITSYFNHNSRDGSISQSLRPASTLSPPLPAETQASLLSVGMRVRKSVPEGYKTHKTLGIAGFPFPSTAPAKRSSGAEWQGSSTGARELTPFCGLHKTGGWAAQEVPSSSAPAVMHRGNDVGVPELDFSQDTLASTQRSFASSGSPDVSSRKRTYEEDAEEEIDAFFHEVDAEEAEARRMARDDRAIAKMKGPSGKAPVGGPLKVVGEDDFEDAAFLAPMEVDRM